jgi:hypothetical protein
MPNTCEATNILTGGQLKQYHADGYLFVPGLIPAEEMAAAHRILLELEAGKQDGWSLEHFQFFDPSKVRSPGGGKIPGGVQQPASQSKVFQAIADHENLRSAMRQILGGPVERFTDQSLIKSKYVQSEQGGQTFFHQDSYYWRIEPQLGCNCWIPFDEVGPDAIALAINPGSHRNWKLEEHEHYFDDPAMCGGRSNEPFKRKRIPLARAADVQEVLIPMKPGDGLFFTNYTWHRSEKNRSGQTKCAYAIAYQRANIRKA